MGCASGTPAGPGLERCYKDGVIMKGVPLPAQKSARLQDLLDAKGAEQLYDELVAALRVVPRTMHGGVYYAKESAARTVADFSDRLEEVGIGLFFCHSEDIINMGVVAEEQWFEFVDRRIQPEYIPDDKVDAKPRRRSSIIARKSSIKKDDAGAGDSRDSFQRTCSTSSKDSNATSLSTADTSNDEQ